MSEKLSEIELKDIEKALEERILGKTRRFSSVDEALTWLRGVDKK